MIAFVGKKTRKIDKNELLFNRIYEQMEELFSEKQSDVILIYDNSKYCGYVERTHMRSIMLPEFCLGFEPVELEAADNLMEQINEYWDNDAKKKIMIPIKLRNTDVCEIFAIDEHESDEEHLLDYLVRYAEIKDAPVLYGNDVEKKVVVLPELNEFTYIYYKMLKERELKYIIKGQYWENIHIHNESVYDEAEFEFIEWNANYAYDLMAKYAKEKISEEVECLRRKGIKAYKVIIPTYEELAEHGEFEEKAWKEGVSKGALLKKDFSNRKFWIDKLIEVEACEGEEELLDFKRPEVYGEQKAKQIIYLAGPCIVRGTTSIEKDSIASILFSKIVEREIECSVNKICKAVPDVFLAKELESLDIRENDMIFVFMDSYMYERRTDDIDLLEDYNNRPVNSDFFLAAPIHTLRCGNEMIVRRLWPLIEKHYANTTVGNRYLQAGKPYLSSKQRFKLEKYLNDLEVRKMDGVFVGCIVMNANPFTEGHLYLVEIAARKVERLLVFVVEEDLSEFTFEDRFQMVKQGVKHLKNVKVIPSGSFILSKHTFVSYFEKDKKQDSKIDSALDIRLFGTYIAPAFGINKRFVGEEPRDKVTRQYNEEMIKKLPLYGIDVEEIPRKEINGEVISATTVRRLYKEKEWENLTGYLPKTTIDYLKCHLITMREKGNIDKRNVPIGFMDGLKALVRKNVAVVLYGTGIDGLGLYRLLDEENKDKVIFCDRRAETGSYFVEGKKVYAPMALFTDLEAYPIVITSTKYGPQIRSELYAMGIHAYRIVQNFYSFYSEK